MKIIEFFKDLVFPPRLSDERFDTGHYVVIRYKEMEPQTWIVNGNKCPANTQEERDTFNKNRKFMQGVTREGFSIIMSDYIYYLKQNVEIIHKGKLTKEEIAFNAEVDKRLTVKNTGINKKLTIENAEQQL
ncbi:MAG: hypothetical protein PHS54_05235 [Clostridia bacterium]|nr:hypothetical protein [Clostridia bacterium]